MFVVGICLTWNLQEYTNNHEFAEFLRFSINSQD